MSHLFRKVQKREAVSPNLFSDMRVSDTKKKCISFVFVNIVRDVTIWFFELGLFSLPFSAMSHYIRESPIFIEERSSVPEDQQEPFPGSSNLTAAAP